MSRFYFAYGSNMHLGQMGNRCPGSHLVGTASLRGYRWIITTRGYANIVSDVRGTVEGLLFLLTPDDERRLDQFEGVDQGSYEKIEVRVLCGGKKVCALTYKDPVVSEGAPRKEYVDRINAAVHDAHLSLEYLQRVIRRFIPA